MLILPETSSIVNITSKSFVFIDYSSLHLFLCLLLSSLKTKVFQGSNSILPHVSSVYVQWSPLWSLAVNVGKRQMVDSCY